MKKILRKILAFSVIFFILIAFANRSEALVIQGTFPLREGKFWNFRQGNSTTIHTWVVAGALSLKDAGRLFLLQQEGERVVALREDWEGLRVYAEFYDDRFYLPEKPLLFLPRDIDPNPDSPAMETTVVMNIFTDPSGTGNFQKTASEIRTVTFRMKSIENIVVNSVEYRDSFVIEKVTSTAGAALKETLWLAHGTGPVKRVVTDGAQESVYALISHAGSEHNSHKKYPVREYFPLCAGEKRIYRTPAGTSVITAIAQQEKARLHDAYLFPYEQPGGDIIYFNFDERGLTIPQRFWESYGGITAYPNHGDAGVFLPAMLRAGDYHSSFSRPRSYNPRSLVMFEENHPEEHYASTVLMTEDVTVPAGVFKDCIKLHCYYVISNFEINFDVVQLGFLWLAPGTGIVKQQTMNLFNYSLPERIASIFNVASLQLQSTEKNQIAAAGKNTGTPDAESRNIGPAVPVKPFEELQWLENSRAMFDIILDEIPFFIRPLAEPKFNKAIAKKAGTAGVVTEKTVFACAREEIAPKYLEQTLKKIEPLRTAR